MQELHVIVVKQRVTHPYWIPGAFVALVASDWGPSPVLEMRHTPQVFTSSGDAQRTIDMFCYRDMLEVATFRRV